MPLIRAFIRGSLDAGQPLPRFASGVPCHAPTLPHRETVCAKTLHSRQDSNLQLPVLETGVLPFELLPYHKSGIQSLPAG